MHGRRTSMQRLRPRTAALERAAVVKRFARLAVVALVAGTPRMRALLPPRQAAVAAAREGEGEQQAALGMSCQRELDACLSLQAPLHCQRTRCGCTHPCTLTKASTAGHTRRRRDRTPAAPACRWGEEAGRFCEPVNRGGSAAMQARRNSLSRQMPAWLVERMIHDALCLTVLGDARELRGDQRRVVSWCGGGWPAIRQAASSSGDRQASAAASTAGDRTWSSAGTPLRS